MRHHVRRQAWRRTAALLLAGVLTFSAFPVLAEEGGEEKPADNEVVQCEDLNEIFEMISTTNKVGVIDGNSIYLAD